MFALSFICHLVFFSLIIWSRAFLALHQAEEPVSYIELVALPVASPQSGTPAPAEEQVVKPVPVEEGREFDDRLAESKKQVEVLARLQNGRGRAAGMAGAKGTEAGSNYSTYILTRLKEVFKREMASQTKFSVVMVRIAIGPDGHITDYHLEKSSGDQLFDAAVSKAVTIAGWTFRPPPNGMPFERVFRFKPEGVGLP